MQIHIKKLEALGWQAVGEGAVELHYISVVSDSRKVKEGSVFIALDGLNFRGADFIGDVISQKAAAVFLDQKDLSKAREFAPGHTLFFTHSDFQAQAPRVVSLLLGEPAASLCSVGVTGTNGKTSICWGLSKMLEALGVKSLYLGTLGYLCGDEQEETGVTTPAMVETANYLHRGLSEGAKYALIEASSHGLHQGRLDTLIWNFSIFTNLTPDHGDYHPDMDHYYECKRRLFEATIAHIKEGKETSINEKTALAKEPALLINTADAWGQKLYDWVKTQESDLPVIALEAGESFSPRANARVRCLEASFQGYGAAIEYDHPQKGKLCFEVKIPAVGSFNLWNYAAIFLTLLSLGFDEKRLIKELARLPGVPGRMEIFHFQGRAAVVDYSHTPDALEKALDTLRELNPRSLGVVFGCGGDRDRKKRPLMGAAAAQRADWVVVSDDNPRTEDPVLIRKEIIEGIDSLFREQENFSVPGREHSDNLDTSGASSDLSASGEASTRDTSDTSGDLASSGGAGKESASGHRDVVEAPGNPGESGRGQKPLLEIGDRREAIFAGLGRLQEGDILLVAGKGHEDYQIVGKTKSYFSDAAVIREYIAGIKKT